MHVFDWFEGNNSLLLLFLFHGRYYTTDLLAENGKNYRFIQDGNLTRFVKNKFTLPTIL